MTDTTASGEASSRSRMGLIDHPLTPLIVEWLEAVNRRAAYDTAETRWAEKEARVKLNAALEDRTIVTDHEMRMYSLDLFEILQAVDHTLTVHGHIDCGTPLHRRISAAIAIPNEDPSGQRREPMSPHLLDDEPPFEIQESP